MTISERRYSECRDIVVLLARVYTGMAAATAVVTSVNFA